MFKKVDIWTNIILKKNHKNLTLNFKWGAIQEWGCIGNDMVFGLVVLQYPVLDMGFTNQRWKSFLSKEKGERF